MTLTQHAKLPVEESTPSVPATPEAWPEDGLEAVNACPVCEEEKREFLYGGLTDRVFFCAPGKWTLYRCKRCMVAYLDPRPTADTIGLAYGRYYTHGVLTDEAKRPTTLLQRVRASLKSGYLAPRYGLDRTASSALGRLLVPFLVPQRLGLNRLVRHLPRHQANQRLLDIGCGNGRFLSVARSLGWEVEGLDPDPDAIRAATESGFRVTQGSLPGTPFDSASFDVITLSHMIEHAPNPVQCLQEVHRLLKPGGMLWLSTPNLDGYSRRRFDDHWLALDPPRHLVLFTRDALALACRKAGFRKIAYRRTLLSDYRSSLAMSEGRDPWEHVDLDTLVSNGRAPLKWPQRAESLFAKAAALVQPDMSDEIILVASKS